MGICSVSWVLIAPPVTIYVVVSCWFVCGFVMCSRVLSILLKFFHSSSKLIKSVFAHCVRGVEVSASFMSEVYGSDFIVEWVLYLIDSSLLLCSFSDVFSDFLTDFSTDAFLELVFYFSFEFPSMLALGVGSLIGSISSWSNGTLDNLLFL